MTTYFVAFIIPLILALLLTPAVRKLALWMGAVDMPDARRVHVEPTPRVGGLAVALATAAPITLLGLYPYPNWLSYLVFRDPSLMVGFAIGAILILLLGVYDDTKGARPILKLLVQILIAVVAYYFGYRIEVIGLPITKTVIELGSWGLPVTILWVVGVINAMNLIDGLDGLASGVAFFSCLTLFVLSAASQNINTALITVSLGGALLGFLYYNFNPASIFLGDTGSMFVGLVLSLSAITCTFKHYTAFSILIPAMAMGVPLLDTVLAMIRRALSGRPIMSADRHHIHHRLLYKGHSQRTVVLVLYSLSAVLSGVSISAAFVDSGFLLALLFLALVLIIVLLVKYMGIAQLIREEWRVRFLNELFGEIGQRTERLIVLRKAIQDATCLEDIWSALLLLRTGFQVIRLEVTLPAVIHSPLTWDSDEPVETSRDRGVGMVSLQVRAGTHGDGKLHVTWLQDPGQPRPELYRLYFEMVRGELEHALSRLDTQHVSPADRRLEPKTEAADPQTDDGQTDDGQTRDGQTRDGQRHELATS